MNLFQKNLITPVYIKSNLSYIKGFILISNIAQKPQTLEEICIEIINPKSSNKEFDRSQKVAI